MNHHQAPKFYTGKGCVKSSKNKQSIPATVYCNGDAFIKLGLSPPLIKPDRYWTNLGVCYLSKNQE